MKELGKIKWMKFIRGIFLGILLVLTMTPAALGAQKTVLVHNVDEMMESLADNTEIVLAPGEYNLSNWQKEEFSERLLHYSDYYDSVCIWAMVAHWTLPGSRISPSGDWIRRPLQQKLLQNSPIRRY